MKMHIEYDDFGEYMEYLEDLQDGTGRSASMQGGGTIIKRIMWKLMMLAAAMTVMFYSTSYASGTCAVKGCYRSAVYGGSYCKNIPVANTIAKTLS